MSIIVYRYLIEVHIEENNYMSTLIKYARTCITASEHSLGAQRFNQYIQTLGELSQCMLRHTYMNLCQKEEPGLTLSHLYLS